MSKVVTIKESSALIRSSQDKKEWLLQIDIEDGDVSARFMFYIQTASMEGPNLASWNALIKKELGANVDIGGSIRLCIEGGILAIRYGTGALTGVTRVKNPNVLLASLKEQLAIAYSVGYVPRL